MDIKCKPHQTWQVKYKRGASVRDKPELRGKRIAVVAKDEKVTVIATKGDHWVQISEPMAGWVQIDSRGRKLLERFEESKKQGPIHYEILGSELSFKEYRESLSGACEFFFKKTRHDLCGLILSYVRLPKGKQLLLGDELWIKVEEKEVRTAVAFLKVSYPWAKCHNTPPIQEHDAFLDTLEIWRRFHVENDFQTRKKVDQEFLSLIGEITKNMGCAGLHNRKTDCFSGWSLNMLSNNYPFTDERMLMESLTDIEFKNYWEIYGDRLGDIRIKHEYTRPHWPRSCKQIEAWKKKLIKLFSPILFPIDLKDVKARHLQLTLIEMDERAEFDADLIISPHAALFQSLHLEKTSSQQQAEATAPPVEEAEPVLNEEQAILAAIAQGPT